MSGVFSTIHGLVVSLSADGSYACSGQYGGADIQSALPSADGKRCVLLLDPDASKRTHFENLFCIDKGGNIIWTAELPSSPGMADCFVAVTRTPEGLRATSWSCWSVLLDQQTGGELRKTLVK